MSHRHPAAHRSLLTARDHDRYFAERFGAAGSLASWVNENSSARTLAPRFAVARTPGGFELRIELPGVTGDQIEVRVEDSRLILEAGLAGGATGGGPRRYESEWRLPPGIDPARITGRLAGGLLRVFLPLPTAHPGSAGGADEK